MMGITMATSQHSDKLQVGPLSLAPAVTVPLIAYVMVGIMMATGQHSDKLQVGPLWLTQAVTVQVMMKKAWRS